MLFTEHSDVFARFHESAFNKILNEVLVQRPSLFNYGTEKIISENRFCQPIQVNPILNSMGIPKSTKVDKLPIVGLDDSSLGVDYCVQLRELKLDFAPDSEINLPQELGSLVLQQFALKGTVCAGIGCTNSRLDPRESSGVAKKVRNRGARNMRTGLKFLPATFLNMHCFCLSLYGKAVVVNDNNHVKLRLVGIELEDIQPLGLENSIECYLKQMLDYTVFPKMKIALEDLSLNVSDYFSIGLTPISNSLPFNPNVSNNYLSLYFNIN